MFYKGDNILFLFRFEKEIIWLAKY